MPYKPTGNPPGRPRKANGEVIVSWPEVLRLLDENPPEPEVHDEIVKRLSRAREGFRRVYANPADKLYSPPRFGERRRHVGKRPILNPNVIAKA